MVPLSRPIIGVTGPSAGGWPAWFFTRLAVRRAGGRARRITVKRPAIAVELDGLIIGGGADIDPELYGETPSLLEAEANSRRPIWRRILRAILFPVIYMMRRVFSTKIDRLESRERDALESRLLVEADQLGLPVLGICRGMQLMNVHRGGSLFQEISGYYTETPAVRSVFPVKSVFVDAGSRLAGLFDEACVKTKPGDDRPEVVFFEDGRCTIRVNSLHHQGVKVSGKNLAITARDGAEIPYALEEIGARRFFLGVQWHPEFLPFEAEQGQIFRALVRAAQSRPSSESPEVSTDVSTAASSTNRSAQSPSSEPARSDSNFASTF